MNDTWVMNVAVVPSICFLGLGLRGLLTKKAFIHSARQMVWVLLSAFAPMMVVIGDQIYDSLTHSFDFMGVLQSAMFALALLLAWKQMSGYFAFGATDEYFQSALYAALRKLDLPFDESFSRIRLTSLGTDLNASVQPWLGTAQLTLTQPQHRSTLRQIARAMKEYFASVPG